MNIERYRMVMHRIWADLRTWDQTRYHGADWSADKFLHRTPTHKCGTTHCVAGWAQLLSGKKGWADPVAEEWLGISGTESSWLFCSGRTLADLNAVLKRGRVFE